MMVCNVKVKSLRNKSCGVYYDNFGEFVKDEDNVYIGRKIYININGKKFYHPGSIWCNPFTEKEYPKEELLWLYKRHLIMLIYTESLYEQLEDLDGKRLGCWCKPGRCHGDILLNVFNKYMDKGKKYIRTKYKQYLKEQEELVVCLPCEKV